MPFHVELSPEVKAMVDSLPVKEIWLGEKVHLYQGFWYNTGILVGVMGFQKHFQARDTDIFIASFPKSGTTWLKSLAFSVLKRFHFPYLKHHPLLTSNSHDIVHSIEFGLIYNSTPDLERFGQPRLLGTHVPYVSLPKSITNSNCKIVYVCRDPKDTFISFWKFINMLDEFKGIGVSLDEAFVTFTQGFFWFCPVWDHILGYWKESLERPDRVLFLRYEAMKNDPRQVLRKLSEFFGCPFSSEEEECGLVEELVNLCSFDTLRSLDVNRNGKQPGGAPHQAYFRRGEVGDSANYLSPDQAKLIDEITAEKFAGSGLSI